MIQAKITQELKDKMLELHRQGETIRWIWGELKDKDITYHNVRAVINGIKTKNKVETKKDVKKYIVTSIQKWWIVNKEFYKNMKCFAKKHKIDQIYCFVMRGQYKDIEDISHTILNDPDIKIITKATLNDNIRLFDSKILPQSIDPFRWLAEKISQNFSYIVPSPKVRYQAVWNYPNLPRCFISTGSLTKASYRMGTQTWVKADAQHQMGFIYLEVEKKKFNPIPVTGTKKGTFHFLNEKYANWKYSHWEIEVLTLWDWHTWDTCPKVRKVTMEMIGNMKPKHVMLHDFFNWHSINHHEEKDSIARARTYLDNKTGLKREVQEAYNELVFFWEKFPDTQFNIVYSNHDDFLRRYVSEDKHIRDLPNRKFAEDLRNILIERGKIGLEEAVKMIWKLPKNINFLDDWESFKVRGVEYGMHWHKGLNGSRWSPHQFRRNNLWAVTWHTHSPMLYSNWMVVWTSTRLDLDYAKWWVSSWLNAHGIWYPDGKYTLLTLIF